jgi:hypothetical protein
MKRRGLIVAVVGPLLFIAFVALIVGSMTYWFGLTRPANAGRAQSVCEDALRHKLLTPTNAAFRDERVKLEQLVEDDNFLLGVDAAHVKEVWAVHGDVASPGISGAPAKSHFICRAYLFDDRPPRTSVNHLDADDAGQWSFRP